MPSKYRENFGYFSQFEQQPVTLRIGDGDTPYNTEAKVAKLIQSIAAGATPSASPAIVWEKTVKVQQAYAWGYGNPMALGAAGSLYPAFIAFHAEADGEFQDGELIFRVTDSNNVTSPETHRYDTGGLRKVDGAAIAANSKASAYVERDRNKLSLPMGQSNWVAREGDRLQILMRTVTPATGDQADKVHFEIPATLLNLGAPD